MVHLRQNGLISVGDFAFVFSISVVIIYETWRITQSMQNFVLIIGDLRSSIAFLSAPQINVDSPVLCL